MPGIAPIIIRNPTMTLQVLDPTTGDPGLAPAVDVSADVASVEIAPDVPQNTVSTFAGKFTALDDPEWGSATCAIVVNEETNTTWETLVGQKVQVQIKDRPELTWFRQFESEVVYNPALAGITEPGSARTSDFPLPILSAVTIEQEGAPLAAEAEAPTNGKKAAAAAAPASA